MTLDCGENGTRARLAGQREMELADGRKVGADVYETAPACVGG